MQVGGVISWERTFTEEDIRLFGRVSGDEGVHHVRPDEQGRLMVQGLLTATLPTKVGGDLNFIASELNFQFRHPVFAGDTVRCEVTVVALEQDEQLIRMAVEWVCRNQHGKEVMTGQGRGVIRTQQ
ncbi:MAG TPA: MaoC family dehydratase N-terminal domain-containing protein [Anaerolineales bacterium]|nr:MaoC family dehydratase N-terminal domain-containing protein [Anaerolineales bacterium]